jgi:two-component system phosphate regulon sensor histidine kinase PhoR
MKRWHTRLLIGLVTISTIGLMIIQVFWIRDAAKVKYSNFIRDVNIAMKEVISHINRLKMQYDLISQKKIYIDNKKLFDTYDSLNSIFFHDIAKVSTAKDFNTLMRRIKKAQKKLQNVTFDYHSLNSDNGFVYNPKLIDSLIELNLRKKGINTTFEYGIYDPFTNSMLLQKTGKYPNELLTESFAYNLASTPGDIYPPQKFLIYFPNEQQVVVKQIWKLLSVSIILFLIIIISFYLSIQTILKQKKLSEMKNDLINNMTHEFKTPISTIALACEALKDKDVKKSDEMYNSYIGIIDEENKRLGTMAEQILQQAVIEKGKLRLNKEIIDVHDIINEAVNRKTLEVQAKGGIIETQLNAENSFVNADVTHLSNVFINLLDNAIKYTVTEPKIVVNTINKKNNILIRVSDNGIGISKSKQKKIFDKLYRVHTGDIHDFKGFGLGLNYVKAIVELHNGSIFVDSEPKKGSTFTVQLPIEKPEQR